MRKTEYYVQSFNLLERRTKMRLEEKDDDKPHRLFNWILSQFYWRLEGYYPPVNSCILIFNACNYGRNFCLKYGIISDHLITADSYSEFCFIVNQALDIFEQSKIFTVVYRNIPEDAKDINGFEISIHFSLK